MDIKEHGMLYKAEMVNAILREIDPKEQTRRPITFANSLTGGAVKRKEWHLLDWDNAEYVSTFVLDSPDLPASNMIPTWHVPFKGSIVVVRPRIWPGHRIWVRETFKYSLRGNDTEKGYEDGIEYRADGTFKQIDYPSPITNDDFKWRPSIFLPRWASRINLNVTGMRSQRIQEISAMDAIAEGIERSQASTVGARATNEVATFHALWDSINTERGFPWVGNHPVWIHDFKRIDKEGADG